MSAKTGVVFSNLEKCYDETTLQSILQNSEDLSYMVSVMIKWVNQRNL